MLNEILSSIPKATEYGTSVLYSIEAIFSGNSHFKPAIRTDKFSVVNEDQMLFVAPKAINRTYNATEQDIFTVAEIENGKIYYKVGVGEYNASDAEYGTGSKQWKTTISKFGAANKYTLYWHIIPNDGYTTPNCDGYVTAEITPDINTITGINSNYIINNGLSQQVAYNTKYNTVVTLKSNSDTNSVQINISNGNINITAAANSGTVKLIFESTQTPNYSSDTKEITITLQPSSQPIVASCKLEDQTHNYTGEAIQLFNEPETQNCTVTYKYNNAATTLYDVKETLPSQFYIITWTATATGGAKFDNGTETATGTATATINYPDLPVIATIYYKNEQITGGDDIERFKTILFANSHEENTIKFNESKETYYFDSWNLHLYINKDTYDYCISDVKLNNETPIFDGNSSYCITANKKDYYYGGNIYGKYNYSYLNDGYIPIAIYLDDLPTAKVAWSINGSESDNLVKTIVLTRDIIAPTEDEFKQWCNSREIIKMPDEWYTDSNGTTTHTFGNAVEKLLSATSIKYSYVESSIKTIGATIIFRIANVPDLNISFNKNVVQGCELPIKITSEDINYATINNIKSSAILYSGHVIGRVTSTDNGEYNITWNNTLPNIINNGILVTNVSELQVEWRIKFKKSTPTLSYTPFIWGEATWSDTSQNIYLNNINTVKWSNGAEPIYDLYSIEYDSQRYSATGWNITENKQLNIPADTQARMYQVDILVSCNETSDYYGPTDRIVADVTINKADGVLPTIESTIHEYDTNAHYAKIGETPDTASRLLYRDEYKEYWHADKPSQTDPGINSFKVKAVGDVNHKDIISDSYSVGVKLQLTLKHNKVNYNIGNVAEGTTEFVFDTREDDYVINEWWNTTFPQYTTTGYGYSNITVTYNNQGINPTGFTINLDTRKVSIPSNLQTGTYTVRFVLSKTYPDLSYIYCLDSIHIEFTIEDTNGSTDIGGDDNNTDIGGDDNNTDSREDNSTNNSVANDTTDNEPDVNNTEG